VIPASQPRELSGARRSILIASITVGLIVLIVVATLTLTLRRQTLDAADRNLVTLSKIAAGQTAQTLSAVDIMMRSLQTLATKPSLPDGNALRDRASTANFQRVLVRWRQLLPQVDAAAIADADGDLLANTRQFPPPRINVAQAPFFQTLKNHPDAGVVIERPVFVTLNNQWMFYLARAIVDDQGQFAGVVLAGIPVSYFEQYFSMIDVGGDAAVTLSSPSAMMIARWPRVADALGKTLPRRPPDFVVPTAGQTAVNLDLGVDRVSRRIATTRLQLENNALDLSVSQSNAAILQPWQTLYLRIGALLTLTLLIIGLLVWLLFGALRSEEDWRVAAVQRETELSKQTLELVAARDQAQTANRARGDFLANMSHELRTPLNAVLGFSEILEKELFGPLGDPRYKDFVVDIHRSGQHLLEIIGNILDLAKVDAGRLELDEQEVDVVDLLRTCVRLVGDAAANARLTLESRLPPRPAILRADPTRLKQILLNLLSNAIKFTPEGHQVILSAGEIDDGYFLKVSDTGIGMSPNDVEKAMLPFHQIDGSLARRYQGTGLGLPLTKSLTELHGGVFRIHSNVGEGTTAIVTLPRSRIVDTQASPSWAE
jgi:signal transduction histidine kinase